MDKIYGKLSGFWATFPRPLRFTFIFGCGALLGIVLSKVV